MTEVFVHHVERTLAPSGWRRARAIRPSGLAEGSAEKYDFDTLFYQAVRQGKDVVLIAPKLLNFRRLFQRARFSVRGVSARVSIAAYYRHAIITLKGLPPGDTLQITFPGGETVSAQIHTCRLDMFAGLNCEMLINKDNDLDWIRERLRFHAEYRGLQAVALVDNESTAYGLDDLAQVVSDVGLTRALILSMPFPWGGMNRKPKARELYLQTSAYNLLRVKYLAQARAVLCLDVDELLVRVPAEQTIFDVASQPGPGLVIFPGVNLYRHASATGKPVFQDHTQSDATPRGSMKWCINPRSLLGRFQWRCHNVERNIFDRFHRDTRFAYYHCLGLTTGWKDQGRMQANPNAVPYPEAEVFFASEMPRAQHM